MKDEIKRTVGELKTTFTILIIIFLLAVLGLSVYSKLDLANASESIMMQVLEIGSGSNSGNAFYLVTIFLILSVTLYMFEKVIILLTQIRVGTILMNASLSSIKNHYIVCGAGRVGKYAAEKLKCSGKKVVIIESNSDKVQEMKDNGFIMVEGDCMDEKVLERAKIRTAKGILACTGDDHKNVFIVLTSKDLNPLIRVASRVNNARAKTEFERAGADIIVAPEITGGYELADKIIGKK
jgi:voltage-gated potassium channel